MSTATLTNLRDYLYGTLTLSNMLWLASQLTEYAEKHEQQLKPYTMAEINAMIDASEAEIAAGKGTPHEEVMHEWDEEIARMEQEELELEMSEAV